MMGGGQAVLIWVVASGFACILLLGWAAVVGLGAGHSDGKPSGRVRLLALLLLALTAALAVLPTGLARLRPITPMPYTQTLFLGASLCLFAACAVLWKLRCTPAAKTSADMGIAACLNLWLALLALLTPLATL